MALRLLQHRAPDGRRSVIVAKDNDAFMLPGIPSVLHLATTAINQGLTLAQAVEHQERGDPIDLHAAYSDGELLSPIAHDDPAHLLMSGTGLTHLGSAEGRDKMHREAVAAEKPTDSMRIFLEGLAGGKPAAGVEGSQPEWFYKGDGSQLVAPGGPIAMPSSAKDGGEEPELAGVYLIGPDGAPYRLGVCLANEFSDHVTERHNYLWLAHSKLRQASLGPELLIGHVPDHLEGYSRIVRAGETIWEKPFLTGEANMSHTLSNLEQHHFKYDLFRRPGDVHVHFFGTATLSFSDGVQTTPGDVFEISASPFTLPLRNTLVRAAAPKNAAVKVL